MIETGRTEASPRPVGTVRQDTRPLARSFTPPLHFLMESGEPQPVFQGAMDFRGVCMLEGHLPPFHPTKRERTESGTIKRK